MPYFYNDSVNLLFIHIPKTGGESLELYFSNKYKIPRNNKFLFMFLPEKFNISNGFNKSISLQHQTYITLYNFRDIFEIKFDRSIKILSCVRNPYKRLISDLFWQKLIDINTDPSRVFEIIKEYINANWDKYDNHNLPQYMFLVDDDGIISDNIVVLRTETLTHDMHNLGYIDFNIRANANSNKLNYYNYLNAQSIQLINDFYTKDFEYFGYDKIKI